MTLRYDLWSFRDCVPAVLASWCLLLAAGDLPAADPPGAIPFQGQWSLKFYVDTRPGGETIVQFLGSTSHRAKGALREMLTEHP